MIEPLAPARLFDLSGQIALVTGASRGIGWAIAQTLAAAGAHVVINGRNPQHLADRLAELDDRGRSAETIASDVGASGAATALVETVLQRHNRLDILVGNVAGTLRKPLIEQTADDWDRVVDATLSANWRLARAAAPVMIEAGYGRLVFVSSINAILARADIAGYVAAKSGLEGLVRSLAVELGPHGITANAIAPGYIVTDGNRPLRAQRPDFVDQIADRVPVRRWGQPDDLATAALYLTAPASAYTNGAVHMVDGGLTVAL